MIVTLLLAGLMTAVHIPLFNWINKGLQNAMKELK